MFNTQQFNVATINSGIIPASVASAPSLAPTLGNPYRLEVYTRLGVWQANVIDWRSGQREASVNVPDTLSLEVAADDASADYLTFPNEVWLWLGQEPEVQQKYTVVARKQVRDGGGNWISVQCESLLGQLAREQVVEYATPEVEDETTRQITPTPTRVRTILGDLLADWQSQTPAIRLGVIDAAIGNIEVVIKFENKSILSCIEDLRRIVGGFFYVDTNRTLSWRRRIGYEVGHWLRLDHNMTAIEVGLDYRSIRNRITCYGGGLTNADSFHATVNDATSQSAYGVIEGAIFHRNIFDEDTLEALAEAELARWARPATTYRIGVVDLSQVDAAAYNFEALMLTLGTEVQVICDDPAVDLYTRVRRVRWDLAEPANVTVEFSDPGAGPEAWGGNEGTDEQTIVDAVVALASRVDALTNDTGVAAAVARTADPSTNNPDDILTVNTSGDKIGALLEEEYGADGAPADGADRLTDAMLDRIIDALSDTSHPKNAGLREAIFGGDEQEGNIWVAFDGS